MKSGWFILWWVLPFPCAHLSWRQYRSSAVNFLTIPRCQAALEHAERDSFPLTLTQELTAGCAPRGGSAVRSRQQISSGLGWALSRHWSLGSTDFNLQIRSSCAAAAWQRTLWQLQEAACAMGGFLFVCFKLPSTWRKRKSRFCCTGSEVRCEIKGLLEKWKAPTVSIRDLAFC